MNYNLAMTPDTLSQLSKVPVGLTLEGMDWLNRAREMDEQRATDLPSLVAHEQRMRPMKETQQDLSNQASLANLPGLQAQSSMLQRKNQMEEMTFDPTIKAKLRELALKSSEDDIKELSLKGEKMLYSSDPQERYQGQRILSASKAMYDEIVKDQRAKEMKAYENSLTMQRDAANNASKEAIAQMKGEFDRDRAAAKDPKDYQALAVKYTLQLQQETDPSKRAMLQMQLEYANAMADRLKFQGTVAPQVNPAAVSGGLLQDPQKPMPQLPGATAPTSSTNYTKGQTYTGKTGKYEYLGGDVKDPKSWKKVQ